jgi:hypothetical protein
MALAGAAVAEKDDRITRAQIAARGQHGDGGRVHARRGREIEVAQALDPWEPSFMDPALTAAFGPFVDFGREDLGQVTQVGGLGALRHFGQPHAFGPHRRQVQVPRRCPNGGLGGSVGHLGHQPTSNRSS